VKPRYACDWHYLNNWNCGDGDLTVSLSLPALHGIDNGNRLRMFVTQYRGVFVIRVIGPIAGAVFDHGADLLATVPVFTRRYHSTSGHRVGDCGDGSRTWPNGLVATTI